jgi:hypothetical protein
MVNRGWPPLFPRVLRWVGTFIHRHGQPRPAGAHPRVSCRASIVIDVDVEMWPGAGRNRYW